jgi:hypothetical protein
MKAFAAVVMLVALFLLYRIAYPKQQVAKKGDDVPEKREIDGENVIGKSLFIRVENSPLKTEKQEEKPAVSAPVNEITDAVIPSERLDEIFEDEPEPDDLDIPEDDEYDEPDDEPDVDEEAEELRQTLEREAELANGFSIEEMETAAKAINSPTDDNAGILYKVEKTDMFEKLVSGDEGKRQRIAAVIDRHIKSLFPEIANESSDDSEYSNFNIEDFLS